MNESISRAAGAEPRAGDAARGDGGGDPRDRPRPAQRTTLYGAPDPEQVRRSFGAPPLAEPLNPSVNDANLKRPERLVRPGHRGCGVALRRAPVPGAGLPGGMRAGRVRRRAPQAPEPTRASPRRRRRGVARRSRGPPRGLHDRRRRDVRPPGEAAGRPDDRGRDGRRHRGRHRREPRQRHPHRPRAGAARRPRRAPDAAASGRPRPTAVAFGKFDGTTPTLLVASPGRDAIDVFTRFTDGAGPTKSYSLAGVSSLGVADLDGDGMDDLVVATTTPMAGPPGSGTGCTAQGCSARLPRDCEPQAASPGSRRSGTPRSSRSAPTAPSTPSGRSRSRRRPAMRPSAPAPAGPRWWPSSTTRPTRSRSSRSRPTDRSPVRRCSRRCLPIPPGLPPRSWARRSTSSAAARAPPLRSGSTRRPARCRPEHLEDLLGRRAAAHRGAEQRGGRGIHLRRHEDGRVRGEGARGEANGSDPRLIGVSRVDCRADSGAAAGAEASRPTGSSSTRAAAASSRSGRHRCITAPRASTSEASRSGARSASASRSASSRTTRSCGARPARRSGGSRTRREPTSPSTTATARRTFRWA